MTRRIILAVVLAVYLLFLFDAVASSRSVRQIG
jgi:hypothetical protein